MYLSGKECQKAKLPEALDAELVMPLAVAIMVKKISCQIRVSRGVVGYILFSHLAFLDVS